MTDRTIAGVMLALGLAMTSGPAAAADQAQPAMPRIDGVREKLSTAAVVSGETPARGDLLRLN